MYCQQSHSPEHRRAFELILASLLAVTLAGCKQQASEAANDVQTETPSPVGPSLPAPIPVLSRGDLINAANLAASAYAAGENSAGTDPLVGRTFSVKVAFGCSGPALEAPATGPVTGDASGLASWSLENEGETIELQMTPGEWAVSALMAGSPEAPNWEAVDGFWITRPWMSADPCPSVAGDPVQAADRRADPQTLGLAAIFETDGSRIGRRNGRAYTFTLRAKDDTPLQPPANGYRLVLEGRVASFPDGRAIRCRATGPDQRPVCVAATRLDRVAFEGAEGNLLSEWRPG